MHGFLFSTFVIGAGLFFELNRPGLLIIYLSPLDLPCSAGSVGVPELRHSATVFGLRAMLGGRRM